MRKSLLTTAAAATFVLVPAGAAMADTATPSPAPNVTTTATSTGATTAASDLLRAGVRRATTAPRAVGARRVEGV